MPINNNFALSLDPALLQKSDFSINGRFGELAIQRLSNYFSGQTQPDQFGSNSFFIFRHCSRASTNSLRSKVLRSRSFNVRKPINGGKKKLFSGACGVTIFWVTLRGELRLALFARRQSEAAVCSALKWQQLTTALNYQLFCNTVRRGLTPQKVAQLELQGVECR